MLFIFTVKMEVIDSLGSGSLHAGITEFGTDQRMVSWHTKSTGLLRWSPICLAMVSPRACQESKKNGCLAAAKCHEENRHWKDGTGKVSATKTLRKLSCLPSTKQKCLFVCLWGWLQQKRWLIHCVRCKVSWLYPNIKQSLCLKQRIKPNGPKQKSPKS